jgi:hypothetical protein
LFKLGIVVFAAFAILFAAVSFQGDAQVDVAAVGLTAASVLCM